MTPREPNLLTLQLTILVSLLPGCCKQVEGLVKQLKSQLADAKTAAATKADQLEGDLAASEQAHRSRQEALRQQVGHTVNISFSNDTCDFKLAEHKNDCLTCCHWVSWSVHGILERAGLAYIGWQGIKGWMVAASVRVLYRIFECAIIAEVGSFCMTLPHRCTSLMGPFGNLVLIASLASCGCLQAIYPSVPGSLMDEVS